MKPLAKGDTLKPALRYTEGRTHSWDENAKEWKRVDTTTARIYFADGRIDYFGDQSLGYAVWLALPKGVRAAFRGRNDETPVYPWDCVDKLPGKE